MLLVAWSGGFRRIEVDACHLTLCACRNRSTMAESFCLPRRRSSTLLSVGVNSNKKMAIPCRSHCSWIRARVVVVWPTVACWYFTSMRPLLFCTKDGFMYILVPTLKGEVQRHVTLFERVYLYKVTTRTLGYQPTPRVRS